MKCNAFNKLTKSDTAKIEEYCQQRVAELLEPLLDDAKERWLKLACIAMANTLQCDEETLMCLLGNYKRVYRQVCRQYEVDNIDNFLNEKLNTLFPSGYPSEWIKQFRRTEKGADDDQTI